MKLADELGFEQVWAVEHHFLEEFSHSSAPEIFLTACAVQTKRIRIGHGIVICVPEFNHPIKIAERIATMDILSRRSARLWLRPLGTWTELGGFGVDPDDDQEDAGTSSCAMIPKMWTQDCFS